MMDKYYERTLSLAVQADGDMHCCPTPDCNCVFVREKEVKEFKCPTCKKHYCLDCKVLWHQGQTCAEY